MCSRRQPTPAPRRARAPSSRDQDRLAELFPAEQQQSVDLLVDQLAGAVGELGGPARSSRQARRDAECIYELAFGVLHRHLTRQTAPSAAEIEHLVDFAVKGCGA